MRIALVTYEFPPFVNGGAGVYAASLARELASVGEDVTVFAPAGAPIEGVRMVQVGGSTRSIVGFWAALPAAVARERRTHGQFHVTHANALAGASLPRLPGLGVRMVTIHHATRGLVPSGWRGLLGRARDLRGETGVVPVLEGREARRADGVITVSEAARGQIAAYYGVSNSKIEFVPNGVDAPQRVDEEAACRLRRSVAPSGGAVILSVGRLEHRKGPDVLLHALREVLRLHPRARLVLAGDGPREEYKLLARRLSVENAVVFLGQVDTQTRDALYQVCDLYISGSRLEGFGLALLEAVAAGKPFVATETGIVQDGLLRGIGGHVAAPGDAHGLAAGVDAILRDPSGAAEVAERARQHVLCNLAWTKSASLTLGAYRHAAQRRKGADLPG